MGQADFSLLDALGDREVLIAQRAQEADQLSARYLAMFRQSPAKDVRFDVYTGDPRELIVQKSAEREVDILVVGHRALGMIQRAIMGSVSEHLVKNAACSVLVC